MKSETDKSETDKNEETRDSFWAIRSFGLAFVVRGFEVVLLTTILSLVNFSFPESSLLTNLAIAFPVVITASYILYRIINRGKKQNV